MLALVEKKLGKASATLVRKELDGLRASIQRKEIVAGDPGDPDANYLDISQQLGGAKWRAADGNFTRHRDKDGLDTTVKVDDKDSIHAKVEAGQVGHRRLGPQRQDRGGALRQLQGRQGLRGRHPPHRRRVHRRCPPPGRGRQHDRRRLRRLQEGRHHGARRCRREGRQGRRLDQRRGDHRQGQAVGVGLARRQGHERRDQGHPRLRQRHHRIARPAATRTARSRRPARSRPRPTR